MSTLQKKYRLNINFQPSGPFLNFNKAKLLTLGKSLDKKNIKIIKPVHNISQDNFPNENIIRKTETNSKDEIIKALKERVSILEEKVKSLETDNDNKATKIKNNTLNLSQGKPNKKITLLPRGVKLNMKLTKNKKLKFINMLNMSNAFIRKNNTRNNSITSLNNSNYHYKNTIEENKNNSRSRNNFNELYSFGFNTNNNIKIRINNSASKNKEKHFTLFPKNKSKQKLFIDVLRRTMTKCSSISTIDKDNNQNSNFNYIKKDSNNTIIPKIPRTKIQHKSEIVKKGSNKFLNILNNNKNIINEKKKQIKELFITNNNSFKEETCKLNNDNLLNNSKSRFDIIQEKLENIKLRTKFLLNFYSSNKIQNLVESNNMSDKKDNSKDMINRNENINILTYNFSNN